jgi:hypothetical protein
MASSPAIEVSASANQARFWIERATVWQLVGPAHKHRGQAAMNPEVRHVDIG